MDAVPLSNLRSGTACAGKRAATDQARSAAASGLLCSSGTGRQAAEPSWDLPGGGGGRITRTISQLYYRHKEKDLSGAGVTFWCFMKAVNWCGNILVLIKEKKASEGERERGDRHKSMLQLDIPNLRQHPSCPLMLLGLCLSLSQALKIRSELLPC